MIYSTGFAAAFLAFDRKQLGPTFGYGVSAIFSLMPLLYFAVRRWVFAKQAVIKKWSVPPTQHNTSMPGREDRQDYEELSASEHLLDSVN